MVGGKIYIIILHRGGGILGQPNTSKKTIYQCLPGISMFCFRIFIPIGEEGQEIKIIFEKQKGQKKVEAQLLIKNNNSFFSI